MNNTKQDGYDRLFNTPLEISLRCLIILVETRQPCDLHRLKVYDYFLLHSSDMDEGPESLHPPSPFQSGELLVKRTLIEKGIRMLIAKGLVQPLFTSSGIKYKAGEYAEAFLNYFDSSYAKKARQVARWVSTTFDDMNDDDLQATVNERIGRWRTEFAGDSLAEEEVE